MTSTSGQASPQFKTIRQLIWLYFWLLIFEGALRKSVLPQFSNPLLLIRDPVVLLIYVAAFQQRVFPWNGFVVTTCLLAALSFAVSLGVNPEHPLVMIYGLRANFLHLPLAFLIPRVFSREHVRRVGYYLLLLAPAMAVLVFFQFTSSPSARVNAGAGVDSFQIETAHNRIRAAGTFSFTTGLLAYVSLVGSFLFYGFFRSKTYPAWLTVPATFALFVMVALSGSRSVLSSVTILVIAAAFISLYRPLLFKGSLKAISILCIVYALIGSWAVFREGMDILNDRIEDGGGVKSGLVERFLSTLLPVESLDKAPLFGYGIGMGTNAAAGIISGKRGFLLAENEWDRAILENGPMLGLAYILLRIAMTFRLGRSIFAPLDQGDALAALLFASTGIGVLNGQFGQPSSLGFSILGMGLCLAAANPEPEGTAGAPPPAPPSLKNRAAAPVRGRSRYSENLP